MFIDRKPEIEWLGNTTISFWLDLVADFEKNSLRDYNLNQI